MLDSPDDKEVTQSQVETMTITDRGLKDYLRHLEISIDQLKDRTVLDIGSGKEGKFAREASKAGINVVSINPELAISKKLRTSINNRVKRFLGLIKEKPPVAVAAKDTGLPFPDEKFDVVISLFSVPHYLSNTDNFAVGLKEMMRVTKKGGSIYLKYKSRDDFLFENEIHKLETHGASVKIISDFDYFAVYKIVKIVKQGQSKNK